MWFCKMELCTNALSQPVLGHKYGFSVACCNLCECNKWLFANVFGHLSHAQGFAISLLCFRSMCSLRPA